MGPTSKSGNARILSSNYQDLLHEAHAGYDFLLVIKTANHGVKLLLDEEVIKVNQNGRTQ